RCVLGVLIVAQHAVAEGEEGALVQRQQRVERRPVARPDRAQESGFLRSGPASGPTLGVLLGKSARPALGGAAAGSHRHPPLFVNADHPLPLLNMLSLGLDWPSLCLSHFSRPAPSSRSAPRPAREGFCGAWANPKER